MKIKIFNLNCPNNSPKSVRDSSIKRTQWLSLKVQRNLITIEWEIQGINKKYRLLMDKNQSLKYTIIDSKKLKPHMR